MFCKLGSCLGVGINYRSEIANDIIKNIDFIDFIEINTEKFFNNKENKFISQIVQSTPIVLHGLTLSIGTILNCVSHEYLNKLSRALNKINCQWFSEHIAVTHVNGIEIRSLTPAEFTEESIEHIVDNAKRIMALTNKPFILENIAYYYRIPTSSLDESYFISEIVSRADCGLLLDLNNLYVNSINHGYDPYNFLNSIPLDRVMEIHLAGCDYMHGMLVDTHASTIKKEVLDLFEYVCQRTYVNGVVIERDAKLDNFSVLLEEVSFIRNILKRNY